MISSLYNDLVSFEVKATIAMSSSPILSSKEHFQLLFSTSLVIMPMTQMIIAMMKYDKHYEDDDDSHVGHWIPGIVFNS